MGPRDRTQARSPIHPTRKDLRVIATGVTRISQVRQRTSRKRIHPTLEKPLRRPILLYQKERREVTPGTRLPTPERMDDTQPLPTSPHSPINQPRQDEETLHQVRRPMGIQ